MRPRPAAAPHPIVLLAVAVWLAACGRELTVDFTDYAPHQRDHVTTRLVPAHSDLATRLVTDGWAFDRPDDAPATWRMTRDRARLWFFSADGSTTRAELYGMIGGDQPRPRVFSYRLNDRHQAIVRWRPGEDHLALPFKARTARAGWNALDLYARRDGAQGLPILTGVRFLDPREGEVANERPQEIFVADGELVTPAESLFDVSFEVPPRGRLRAEARAEAPLAKAEELRAQIHLLDPQGLWHELARVRIDGAGSEEVDASLGPWVGETVTVRIAVEGTRGSAVRWSYAGVAGGGTPATAGPPILPARPEAGGRLGRPDVFIIVLDTARADAFGAYGAEQPTPSVDRLASEGTRFDRALAPSAWTGQSIPALLTGFHPDTLGTERWADELPEQVPHIAELMAAAGYRTVLWSQHPIYNRAESLVRGFERFRYSGRRKRDRLPPRQFLFDRRRPTFALIHLLPPHSPYTPPPPFRGRHTSEYRGKLGPRLGALGRIGKKRALQLSPEDHDYIYGRYLENVAFADWLVGQIVGHLEAYDRYHDAMVVVTSDHGEAFFEHELFMHSRELYDEFIHIPMVVKWPAAASGHAPSIAAPTSLIDLVPTLVDGLGLEGADRGFQGRSLLPQTFDGEPLERAIYSTTRGLGDVDKTGKPRWMLEEDGWKVLHDPIDARTELYALAEDPGERNDLAERHPTKLRLLLQRLLMQRRFNLDLLQLGPRSETELDPELVEELKALGYL